MDAAAVRAEAHEHHVGVLGLEARGAGRAARAVVVDRRLEVLHATAAAAHDVLMLVGAGVEERGAGLGGHAPDQAKLLEELEGRVNGRQRHVRQLGARLAQDILRRHVTPGTAEDAVEDKTLRRDALPARAEECGELAVECVALGSH